MIEIKIGVFGQSFVPAISANPGLSVLTKELAAHGYAVNVVSYFSDGSAVLKENAPAAHPTRWWWDDINPTLGPAMTAALAIINALPLASRPDHLFWLQGEGDSVAPQSAGEGDRHRLATAQVVWRLKLACANNISAAASLIPTFTHRIGRRISSAPVPGVQTIREAQLALDASSPSVHFLADSWDLPLLHEDPQGRFVGNSHLIPYNGETVLAWRAAQTLLNYLGKPSYRAPRLETVTRVTDSAFDLTFSTAPFLVIDPPSTVSEFAIRDGSQIHEAPALTFSWLNGTTLRVTAPAPVPAGAVLLYPFGSLNEIDRDATIKDTLGTPVQTFARVVP